MLKSPSKMTISEETPLLAPSIECGDAFDVSTPRRRRWQTVRFTTTFFIIVIVLVTSGDDFIRAPKMRINEAILCYDYYEKTDPSKILLDRTQVGPGAIGGVDEALCKVDEVQNLLAALNGWQSMFDQIPSLLLAVPYGWIADKYGRWPVLVLGMVSFVCTVAWPQVVTWHWQTFDIRMQWLSSAAYLLGGGSVVISAMIFVVMTDITPESERAALFLWAAAFSLSSGLFVPALAAWLMEYSPWIPALCGTGVTVLALLITFLLPETLNWQMVAPASGIVEVDGDIAAEDDPSKDESQGWKSTAVRVWRRSKASVAFLTTDWRIPVLMIPFVGYITMANGVSLLLQYLSKRYELDLAKATLVLTVRSAAQLITFFAIVPALSLLLTRRLRLSSQRKDLYLARGMQLLFIVGYLIVALSPTLGGAVTGLIVSSLGLAAPVVLRSFMISVIPPAHVARTLTVLGIVDSLGLMACAPVLAWVFKCGLAAGGVWIGLPYFGIAVIAALCALVLFAVQIRPGEGAAHLTQAGGEEGQEAL